jgi:spermidine synthase
VRRQVVLDRPYPMPDGDRAPGAGRGGPSGASGARLLSWEEGPLAQVAVVEEDGVRSLLINGKADASTGSGDMRTQLLLGHLPVLLAPSPPRGRAMVIGLGSGVTAGAVASWGFEEITVAEIEPAVVRASRWFEAANRAALRDPRVAVHVDDARRVLARAAPGLSLITSEPSNLWMSGVSLLFTREFFELAADRLAADGVLCQWLHLYQVGPDDVRTLLATMSGPFPHLLAFADGTDLLVVGSRSPLVLDPAEWQRRLALSPAATTDLLAAGVDTAEEIATGFVADQKGITRWVAGADLHTDDRPILEFTAARQMARDRSGPILAALVAAGVAEGPIPLGSAGVVR